MAQDYIRARSPERKAERYAQIMEAADALFHELPYQEISPTTIAERLGWSRGNLYKYAATKEEVYLALYERENQAFVADLVAALEAGPLDADGLASTWATCIDAHHDFVRYQAVLTTILEVNVPFERLVSFKTQLRADMVPAVEALGAKLPGWTEADVVSFYLALVYHAAGLRGHYLGTDKQREAMELANMSVGSDTFLAANERFARTLLAGYVAIGE